MGTEIVDIGRMRWQPPVDLYETEDGAIVRVEAAGLREGEYAVQLRGDQLVVAGTRGGMSARRPLACHRLEIASGGFQVEVRLPWPADAEGVEVRYEAGIITVRVPRRQG